MLTKDAISALLATNDKAVARALVVINNNQTADEQLQETVKYRNGEGFRPCHAKMGTAMAQFYTRRGYLSPKQIAYWRKTDKTGTMRLAIYWRQLALAAEAKAAVAKPVAAPVGDVGNMSEELMVLDEAIAHAEYDFGMYQDSDDDRVLKQMRCNIENMRDKADMLRKEITRAYAAM